MTTDPTVNGVHHKGPTELESRMSGQPDASSRPATSSSQTPGRDTRPGVSHSMGWHQHGPGYESHWMCYHKMIPNSGEDFNYLAGISGQFSNTMLGHYPLYYRVLVCCICGHTVLQYDKFEELRKDMHPDLFP